MKLIRIGLGVMIFTSLGVVGSFVEAQHNLPDIQLLSNQKADFSQINAGYGYENWGSKKYIPYFDIGANPQDPLLLYNYMNTTGTNHAFLGFVLTNPKTGSLVWGGSNSPIDSLNPNGRDMTFDDIRRLRMLGKDVGIAFGGAGAVALPENVKEIPEAVEEYKEFIKAYGFTYVDFDIEGNLTNLHEGHEKRAQIIKELKSELLEEEHPLNISYTLALGKNGIENKELAIIEPTIAAGVDIDTINFMAFDYGEIDGSLVETTERALQNTHQTLKETYQKYGYNKTDSEIWKMMGSTAMTTEDDQGHAYTPEDIDKTISFANEVGLGMLSMWSINRDSLDNDWLHPGQEEGLYSKLFSKFQTNDGSQETFKPIRPYEYPNYNELASYNAGARVQYNNKNYLCKGWANPGDNPETATWAWEILK